MTNPISFKAKNGRDANGVIAEPPGDGKAPALVVLQEFWGLNDHVKSLVERFAAEGFVVVAPDLYHGQVTDDAAEAAKLMTALDTLEAVQEIAGAVAFLKAHPRSNGSVGVTGFCLGGALTLAAACHIPGIGAAVPFYGIPPAEKVDYAKVTASIQMHVAKNDEWVTVSRAEEVKQKVEAGGHSLELHVYDAQHAFMNDTRPAVYSAEHATLAWERALAFLKSRLA